MKVLRTVGELREALAPIRRDGRAIGLVPTMGALHEGHLSLVRHSREQCDVTVVSLFVNPSQFDERADLERYPRDERRDATLAEAAGADVLFAPGVEEVYPAGFATCVEVLGISERLEGAARGAEHFRGVATVVAKLLGMVQPDVAYFGQKDAQQVLVIRRLVADLNLPVRVRALPTVREPDGLAMSSRNTLLDARERERALALYAALQATAGSAARGERRAERLLAVGHHELAARGVQAEYLELVDPQTLERVERLDRTALLAVAARVGRTRLIDNLILQPLSHAAEQLPRSGPHESQDAQDSQPPTSGKAIATCSA